jgi:hypothetical protein
VWPECFLTRVGRSAAHFSRGKVHGADYVVNDVCASCNNQVLSELDEYFCRLYDQYFEQMLDFNTTVDFHYDFALLARALLKIAYNAARSAGSESVPLLARLRSAILGTAPLPNQFALLAELVSPTIVQDAREPSGSRIVMPTMYRSAVTKVLAPGMEAIHSRFVAVNSFYFHIVLPVGNMADNEFGQSIGRLPEFIEGLVPVTAAQTAISLRTSPQDGISSIVPHLRANSEQYKTFFDKRRPRG